MIVLSIGIMTLVLSLGLYGITNSINDIQYELKKIREELTAKESG